MNSGEDSALPMVSSSSSTLRKYEGTVSPDSSCKKISVVSAKSGSRQGRWAHNLWEECILPEGKTPRLAEAQGIIALALSTWKKEFKSKYK